MEVVEATVNGEKSNNFVTHALVRKKYRNHIAISSSASLSSPLISNPPDSPEFFTCHSCGILDGGVRTLDSQWRVVLVCQGCHDRIRSADICSYCFNTRDVDVLVCRSCLCRVHLSCVHVQRGFITLSEVDPVSFTCIDCCAIQKPQFRNLRRSRVLLEDLVRNVSSAAKKKVATAARARLNALKKADDARVAMDQAFDAIQFARDAAVADEKFAMQLHRDMNGSSRILRKWGQWGQSNLCNFLPVKKYCGNGTVSLKGRKPGNWRGRAHEKHGICRNDAAVFESNKSHIKSGNNVKNEFSEIDVQYANGSTEVTLAKKGRYYDEVLDCNEVINNDGLTFISCRESADSNSLVDASECGTGAGEDSPEECTVPGLCVKILQENL